MIGMTVGRLFTGRYAALANWSSYDAILLLLKGIKNVFFLLIINSFRTNKLLTPQIKFWARISIPVATSYLTL